MTTHYKNFDSINTIEDVKSIFPSGISDENNWCLFSTSGVHGTYTTIENIERYYENPDKFNQEENDGEEYEPKLTILVIRPRIVSMLYGHIEVAEDDLQYLKQLADSSIEQIKNSQKGNTPYREEEDQA